ncbi:MAG: TonB-dependent receptor [Hyphococcus sp.]|nr:MAG: TonB-dependent receptor [Marinicaulis sp.]
MKMQPKKLLLGVSSLAFVAGFGNATAWAQDGDNADDDNDVIVVTSQRREQNILDVPISVSVIDDEAIEDRNIRGSREYVQLAPNVFFSGNDSQGTRNGDITIRGISDLTSGANERIIQTRPSVGFYVDDFSVASVASGSANPPLDDVERIEILRGPQTTYFGRSATGGAINVVSKKPDETPMAKIRAGYGSYDTYQFGAIGNVPLSDNLFVRGGISYEETDGAVKNLHPDGNSATGEYINGRLAIRWQPQNWTFDLTGQIIRSDEGNLGRIPTGVDVGGPAVGPTAAAGLAATCGIAAADFSFPANNRTNCENADTFTKTENDLVTFRAFYDADSFTVTSITGYIATRFDQLEDLDNGGADVFNRANDYTSESFSQELRLASADPYDLGGMTFGWTLGGYYYDDAFQANNTIISGTDTAPAFVGFLTVPGDHPNENNQHVNRDGWAVFADFEVGLTDALTLTAGVRYSEDNDEQFWTNTYTSFACAPRMIAGGVIPPLAAGCELRPDQMGTLPIFTDGTDFFVTGGRLDQIAANPFTAGTNSSTDVSPRIALTWRPDENHSIYATYSTGYRPAGTRIAPDSSGVGSLGDTRSFFDKENVTNYEIGWKGTLADGLLYGELSLFRIEWDDMQVRLSRTVCEPAPGVLVETTDPACTGLPFFPDNRVNNANSARSQGAEFSLLARPTDGFIVTGSVGYLDAEFTDFTDSSIGDVTGQRMPFSPKWSLAGSASYEWEMGNGMGASLRGDVVHRTSTFLRFGDLSNPGFPYETGPSTMVNLGAGIDWDNHRINISVNNVFEEDIPGGIDSFSGLGTVVLPSPRTWLLSWTSQFGG